MAKTSSSMSFKNATICVADGTITEVMKDETKTYSIENLLKKWDGVAGISIVFKADDDIPEDGEGE